MLGQQNSAGCHNTTHPPELLLRQCSHGSVHPHTATTDDDDVHSAGTNLSPTRVLVPGHKRQARMGSSGVQTAAWGNDSLVLAGISFDQTCGRLAQTSTVVSAQFCTLGEQTLVQNPGTKPRARSNSGQTHHQPKAAPSNTWQSQTGKHRGSWLPLQPTPAVFVQCGNTLQIQRKEAQHKNLPPSFPVWRTITGGACSHAHALLHTPTCSTPQEAPSISWQDQQEQPLAAERRPPLTAAASALSTCGQLTLASCQTAATAHQRRCCACRARCARGADRTAAGAAAAALAHPAEGSQPAPGTHRDCRCLCSH